MSYRNSYKQHLTDEESSECSASYMDDLDIRRKGDRRDSAGRSIRSSRQSLKSSPQRSFDEDSETFARRHYRHSARERRASSSARSISSRTERRPSQRVRSDSTQDSETELGTRALVQAKIREKVAQASSMDESSNVRSESSSDLFKPKSMPTKVEKTPAAPKPIKPIATKAIEKVAKPVAKALDRKRSVERTIKPKATTALQTTSAAVQKVVAKIESKTTAKEPDTNEIDLNSVPDAASDGPPKTPDYDWTCEYCTFVNEANVKICSICCKTPSATAIRKPVTPEKEKKPPINGKLNENAEISNEGRTKKISRKISFWPGTKQAK